MNKNLKIISGLIVLFVVIFSIISVYSVYYAPVDAQTYESQISYINNQFQQILENDRRYMGTTQEPSEENIDSQLKSLIDQMDALQKRGFPTQYNSFNEHFTNSMISYLQWRSHGRYTNSNYSDLINGSKEMEIAYNSFNNVSITYKITAS